MPPLPCACLGREVERGLFFDQLSRLPAVRREERNHSRSHHDERPDQERALVSAVLVPGSVLFAPFFLGLALLALTGVLGGLGDRSVRQHNPPMNPRGWRGGR